MKKINNFIKSRSFVITLFLVFIALIIAGVTYAWFTWSSTDNTNMTMQIGEYTTVTFSGGNAINVNNLAPVYNYTDGESTSFSLTNNNDDITMEFKYNVYLDITTISNELKTTVFKYILLDGSSNIIDQGNFSTASNGSTLTITENKTLPNGNSSYTFIIYIDGNEENNANMMNKSLSGSLRVVVERKPVTAANYITNLYNAAEKSNATVDSITYNLAPSVNLMNDRYGSMDTDIDGGNIRYYGANPNNYVWLGDTYTSTYTFSSNGTSITRNVGDKKLWRIIGVFDGRLKLIQNDPISTQVLVWDTSASSVNDGYGINQWGPSGTYTGADLMKLLNPGYEDNKDLNSSGATITVNNSLYWNKETGTVYSASNNATKNNISFANTGLSTMEQHLIDEAIWYLGAASNNLYASYHYTAERQGSNLGKKCTLGESTCNDEVTRTPTWNGKVGLMYASDYLYATDFRSCLQASSNYNSSENAYACRTNDWLYDSSFSQHSLSVRFHSTNAFHVYDVSSEGKVVNANARNGTFVRPAVYLKSGVSIDIDGKDGSFEHPYVLSLN